MAKGFENSSKEDVIELLKKIDNLQEFFIEQMDIMTSKVSSIVIDNQARLFMEQQKRIIAVEDAAREMRLRYDEELQILKEQGPGYEWVKRHWFKILATSVTFLIFWELFKKLLYTLLQ